MTPKKLITLSETDVATLSEMAREHRTRYQNDRVRTVVERDQSQAPDVYIGLTSHDGIPGLLSAPGTGTYGSDDTPGVGECDIFRIDWTTTPHSLVYCGFSRDVYNLSTDRIGPVYWVLLAKEKFGSWIITDVLADSESAGAAGMTSFAVAGRTGTTTITNGDTLTLNRTQVTAVDTVTPDDASETLPGDVNLSNQVLGVGTKAVNKLVVGSNDVTTQPGVNVAYFAGTIAQYSSGGSLYHSFSNHDTNAAFSGALSHYGYYTSATNWAHYFELAAEDGTVLSRGPKFGRFVTATNDFYGIVAVDMGLVPTSGSYGYSVYHHNLGTWSYGQSSSPLGLVFTDGILTGGSLSVASTDISDFNEAAQDTVGGIFTDSSTIDFDYNDGTPSITAAAIYQMSITADASGLKLSGDSASPGNDYFYGTDAVGTKGWYAVPVASVTDTATVDLTLTGSALSADVIKQMSITSDASGLKLDGDASSPGNSYYYGTNGTGTKGFYTLPPDYTADSELNAIAGLTSAADLGIMFTGSGTASTYSLTAAGLALLDDADASAQRTTLGLGTMAQENIGVASFGPSAVTSITVVNGVITAIS